MRAVVQRSGLSQVTTGGALIASIERGLLVYVGIEPADTDNDARWIADKILNLRIFPDDEGKMNRSVKDVDGGILLVSQFTLHADVRKGRRPSYENAAPPEYARPLYDKLLAMVSATGIFTQAGSFGAHMEVSSTNQGPVTILLDSKKLF